MTSAQGTSQGHVLGHLRNDPLGSAFKKKKNHTVSPQLHQPSICGGTEKCNVYKL